MRLLALYLRNYRNWREATLQFGPKLNYIYGDNAQGKTNLLEAIHLLITGRSFRTNHLSDLIRFGEDHFYIEALFEKGGIEQSLKMTYDGKGRKVFHNATPLLALSSLLGILNGVIVSPEDRELVNGGPSKRRHFLDLQIAQTHPLYLHHLGRFIKAMKQRNHLLRHQELTAIEVWEEQMAQSGAFITLQRKKTTDELASYLQPIDSLTLHYKSQALFHQEIAEHETLKQFFLEQYDKNRERECERGSTVSGPHRDDLEFSIEKRQARLFGSEGQQRSTVAALRLAEWERLHHLTGEPPMMCIDDAGISLDHHRIATLHERLTHLGQVFLTSPRLESSLPPETHLVCVAAGDVVQKGEPTMPSSLPHQEPLAQGIYQ